MKLLPQSLGARLLLAFVAAAVGVAVLAWSVRDRGAVRAAERRAAAPLPPPPPTLGVALAPCGGTVLLASQRSAVPPDAAPVVELFLDGSAVVRRPAPLATTPAGGGGDDAAILLPQRDLSTLPPAVRAALLDLLGQLVAGRPVPPARLRLVDVAVPEVELVQLLRWVP